MIKHANMSKGRAGGSLLRSPVDIPTHEEDLQLIDAAQAGSLIARNELIVRHLPAAIQFAGVYHKRRGYPVHVEVEDLIHVCVFGMIHAIRKYNEAKAKGRFISYARFWMRNYMGKAINTYRMYCIPETTRFAYERGKLHNPETQKAIEHFHDMGLYGCNTRIYDRQLSPVDEAILREELERAGFTR